MGRACASAISDELRYETPMSATTSALPVDHDARLGRALRSLDGLSLARRLALTPTGSAA